MNFVSNFSHILCKPLKCFEIQYYSLVIKISFPGCSAYLLEYKSDFQNCSGKIVKLFLMSFPDSGFSYKGTQNRNGYKHFFPVNFRWVIAPLIPFVFFSFFSEWMF